MSKTFILLIAVGFVNLLLFLGTFKLLQNDFVYQQTLGKFSQNYERTGTWDNYQINLVSKPYNELSNENFLNWDASIFKCISERSYTPEEKCYGKVRAAFFPLFPFLWKFTHLSPMGIAGLNYLLFILSISILTILFIKGSNYKKASLFAILITLPTAIIFYIPYSEALFLLTMTITVVGILRNRYGLYFAGIVLMALVRPATVFVMLAFLAVELVLFMRHGRFSKFVWSSFHRTFPFLIGYFVAAFVQYTSSGSWRSFLDSQQYWQGGLQKISSISDWSVEGFGMNSFAIFFIGIPSLVLVIYLFLNAGNRRRNWFHPTANNKTDYIFLVSVFYLTGIFIFTLFTSGGNLHSFFRFTLASPPFYIAILILIGYLGKTNPAKIILSLMALSITLFLFLFLTEYGGERLRFSFLGMYLLIITCAYLLLRNNLSRIADGFLLTFLIISGTVWNTYLLNAFFSNGWIFT